MRRFWKDVSVEAHGGGYRVLLDAKPIRTPHGAEQVVPTEALAQALAEEWRLPGDVVDPARFVLRDLADYAIDHIRPRRAEIAAGLLAYGETDTLCYRADPDEPLHRRQLEVWEPLLTAFEKRHDLAFERVSGIVHRPQPAATLARLRGLLEIQDEFALSALSALAPLAASLTTALSALEPDADSAALFDAANCEQDWQAALWGWDSDAQAVRAARRQAFEAAANFARLARG